MGTDIQWRNIVGNVHFKYGEEEEMTRLGR
jgi:hypothetical protein